jgi:hypothetical protein
MVRHFLSPVVTKAVAALVVACALTVLPTPARAQDPAAASGALGQGFGDKGQLVISGELTGFFSKTNHAGWTAVIQPAADYFIMPSISVGGAVTLLIGAESRRGFGIGGRAGYNLNVNEHVGAWPVVGVSYAKETGPFAASATVAHFYVPILYHVVPRVFIGLGPFYDLKIAGDGNNSYGVRSTVGGWF